MPAIFVHGVPETHRSWDAVRSHLKRRDVIALDLPGFDAPVPPGFGATKDEYADWLVAEIEKAGEPVDLVGHDWGSLLTLRAASLRPDLVRTWAAGAGAVHPDYTWHDVARIWQTPGAGEQMMQGMTPEAGSIALAGAGVPEADAREMASHIDDTMKDCILKLYRSAVEVGREWYPDIVAKIPRGGLLIWGAGDIYMQLNFAEMLATDIGARLEVLPDTGHWWPVQRPAEVARLLEDHWQVASSQ